MFSQASLILEFLHRQDRIILLNWLFFLVKRALHFATKLNSRDIEKSNCFIWAPSYDLCNCNWWEGVWGRSNLPQKKFNSPFWTKVWTPPPPTSPNKKFLDPPPQWQPWAAVSPSLSGSTVHRYWNSLLLLLFFKPLSSLSNSIPLCSLRSLLEIYMQCIIHSWQVLIIWIMKTGIAWPVQILCNNSSLTTLFGHSLACTVVVFWQSIASIFSA